MFTLCIYYTYYLNYIPSIILSLLFTSIYTICTIDCSFLGMYYDEQMQALKEYQYYMENIRFRAHDKDNFAMITFQKGALYTIQAARHLQHDLATIYNQPLLLTAWTTQDYLERIFGIIRGLGGGFNLHPTDLQYHQRLGQWVKQLCLEKKEFDLVSRKSEFEITKIEDVEKSSAASNLPTITVESVVKGGLITIAKKVSLAIKNQDMETLNDDILVMHGLFDEYHPKDFLRKELFTITGNSNETQISRGVVRYVVG